MTREYIWVVYMDTWVYENNAYGYLMNGMVTKRGMLVRNRHKMSKPLGIWDPSASQEMFEHWHTDDLLM